MNNNEAKFLLCAYRPGGRDADDPAFAEALAQARNDPALGAWFERERAFDTVVAKQLGTVMPPPGLREAILAGASVSRSSQAPWRLPAWLALAASAVLLLGLGAFWRLRLTTRVNPLAAFAMADSRSERPVYRGDATNDLHRALNNPNMRLASLSVDFETLRATGCHTLSFAGHDVLQICFTRDGRWFHLYMVKKADFPEIAAVDGPHMMKQDGWLALQWANPQHLFIVTTQADDPSVLRALL
ncbi:MAG: hypothetical protein ABSE59_01410 [Opitutaceae bacterium]|jgi:hypothetical protein